MKPEDSIVFAVDVDPSMREALSRLFRSVGIRAQIFSSAEEFLRFREEKRAESSEAALLTLTREVNRLGQELKAGNERLVAYAKEHNMPDLSNQSYIWFKRYALNAGLAVQSIGRLIQLHGLIVTELPMTTRLVPDRRKTLQCSTMLEARHEG